MKKPEYKVAPVATFESVDAFCAGSRAAYNVEPLREKDSCSLWTVLCRLFTIAAPSTGDRAPLYTTPNRAPRFDRASLYTTPNRETFDRAPLYTITPNRPPLYIPDKLK